ncbi:response regulator [Phormidium tenue FACHB-886]|nr:response regulator [Phormidium tenue FACHB-886]
MAALMQSHDWSRSPLGSMQNWSQSLKSLIKTLLASRYPMVLIWGAERTQFYNDAYALLIGDKHPTALGTDIKVTLAESWDILGPMIQKVMSTGVANWTPALLLVLERSGYREESYFSVSHAPAEDDSGTIVGMLAVCSEVTQQVLGERRLRLLRDLASKAGETRSVEATCQDLMTAVAAYPLDVPFALLYLRESDGVTLSLQGAVGLPINGAASPSTVRLDPSNPTRPDNLTGSNLTGSNLTGSKIDAAQLWSLARAAAGETVLVESVDRHAIAPGGPWGEPVCSALVMPIASSGQMAPLGALVAGISPNRALDEGYRSFYELFASQVSVSIRNAHAYEEERKRAEALAELDRAKTSFFSNISHEFRTPLTLMLGPVEQLLSETAEPLTSAQRLQIETVHRNSLRLLKLVNTLLEFSRTEAGRTQALYQPTDLASLTAELASMFRSAIEQAGMRLRIECPPLPEPIYVDCAMWEKIVLNLLSNAFKFTLDGEIAVSLRWMEQRNSVELEVRDTGIGIPAAEIPHLFERFHRVKEARGRTYEGSGIGLSLVQELVRLQGGTICVESEVEVGTRFKVSIPTGITHLPAEQIDSGTAAFMRREGVAAAATPYLTEALNWLPTAEEQAQRHAATLRPAPRILLADDNIDMRNYVKRLLSPFYEVEAVADGAAALAAVQRRRPDLVLSDVMMPDMGGFELLRSLRADPHTQKIPVILLSARAGEESRIDGLEAGADDYLIKPFSAPELLARVKTHLELAQLRQAVSSEREQQLQTEAQTAKANLERALATINEQFLVLDSEWRYVYVNDRVVEVNGVSKQELVGKSIWDVFPDTVETQFYKEVHRVAAEKTASRFEYFYPALNRWFENHVYSLPDNLVIIVADITDRKQTEAALRESELKFRTIADTMPQIVWSTTSDGYHDYFNKRWYEYTGMPRTGTQGWNWKDYLHPEDYERTLEIWQCSLKTNTAYEVEYRFRRASDGAYRWFIGRALPVQDEQGNTVRWFGTCTDVDDQRRLLEQQEQLLERERSTRNEVERVSRMKDEFLATLSHELRTPLNALLGWSHILRKGGLKPELVERGMNTIDRNIRMQAQLIEDLLDMNRIVSGKIRLNVQRIDLLAVIDAALETVRLAADAKEIRLQKVLDPLAGIVSGDATRLQQIIWNLLSNAIKFTPKRGRVLVVLERVHSHVEISIIDTGQGIDPVFLPHVFERFQQADSSITRTHGGLGLGLSIVRGLTELHGGTVRVESAGLGKGATFVVSLPLMAVYSAAADAPRLEAEGENASSDAGSPSLRGIKILVVDDELDARELIKLILEQAQATVVTAGSAQQALALLKQAPPDLLISDIGLPNEDGYQLIRKVRSLSADQGGKIPAVALTAYARTEDRKLALLSGYQMHIAKPVEPAELVAIVNSLASLRQC